MQSNDHSSQSPQSPKGEGILEDALRAACGEGGEAWASHEEIALVAQSGITAIPDSERDRVLRAIVVNADGASAVFDLAEIAEHDAADLGDDHLSATKEQAEQPLESDQASYVISRFTMPAWGLAASVMLVSGVGIMMESQLTQNPLDTARPIGVPDGNPNPTHTAQSKTPETQSNQAQPDPLGVDSGVGLDLMIPVFLVALICTIALTPIIWRRSRNSTR